jgi:3-deoxy-7-phosphoheptulonate synthase
VSETDDLRIRRTRPLIAPSALAEEIPLSAAAARLVREARRQIAEIVHGRAERALLIVGPCSVHDTAAVLEYAQRLRPLAEAVSERIFVVMRVYFEKPRTTVGWKGFINDPHLDGSFEVNAGLRGARELLSQVTDLGLPAGTEFLDTTFGQYYTDFISWGAIGARTVESQVHRQLASGLSMPVGIKNGTDGNVDIAIDALVAAQSSHHFPSLTKEGAPALFETRGNEDCHLVLRGGRQPNYDRRSVERTFDTLTARGLETGILVDCSHGNSGKDPARQGDVLDAVLEQRRAGQSRLIGAMLESHLLGGRQNQPTVYGRSITDACLSWEETESLVRRMADRGAGPDARR